MKSRLLLAMLVCTPGLLIACMFTSLPPIGGGGAPTRPVLTPPSSTPSTNNTPAPTPTTSIPSSTNTPAAPVLRSFSQPRGLTAVNNFEPSTRVGSLFDERTYSNPNMAGLTFRTSWADIEPSDGSFVWDKLDTVFDKAEKNGKWVELVLIPGFGAPAWALQGAQSATFSVKYGPGKGEDLLLPLPWDQTYLDRWYAFLKAVSARYQNRPSFIKIAVDGPTSVTAEMSLPNEPADLCTWIKVGYTSERLIAAWKQVFENYAQIFPRQFLSLALYPPPPIVSKTRCDSDTPRATDHSESQRVRDVIIALGADQFPRQFVLQTNGLTAAKEDPSNSGGYAIVKGYGAKVVIGFQLTTSAIMHPANMGDPDGATALQKSLQKGVDAKAQFLEVYEPDVLAPVAQSVLASFASLLNTTNTTPPMTDATVTAPSPTLASLATPPVGVKMASGVFIVTAHNSAIRPATYTNPAVDGIVIRTFWSAVQSTPDGFDWTFIDSQVQAAASGGKKVILVVLPGAFTPAWALQGVQTAQFNVDYGFMQGQTVTLPLPWDATYLKRWFAFVSALGQRYDSNPALVNVPAAGPTSISEEMSLPNDPAALAQWKRLGYDMQKYTGAWQQTLAAYIQSFPTTQISLTFYPGLPIPDAAAETATRVEVANFAFTSYGQHVAFQENGLSARKSTLSLGYDLVQQYAARTAGGFEMGTSATQKPEQMGGSTAAAALQASVELGLKAGIKFLEIYETDALNPDLQDILAHTHTTLTQ